MNIGKKLSIYLAYRQKKQGTVNFFIQIVNIFLLDSKINSAKIGLFNKPPPYLEVFSDEQQIKF